MTDKANEEQADLPCNDEKFRVLNLNFHSSVHEIYSVGAQIFIGNHAYEFVQPNKYSHSIHALSVLPKSQPLERLF
jgi:hypothetical protein